MFLYNTPYGYRPTILTRVIMFGLTAVIMSIVLHFIVTDQIIPGISIAGMVHHALSIAHQTLSGGGIGSLLGGGSGGQNELLNNVLGN